MSVKSFCGNDNVPVRRAMPSLDAVFARKDLARSNEFLVLEAQHRIANSLQIVAGLALLKSGEPVSEETRFHLKDFHQRVMLVARLQRQLSANALGDEIDFDIYLTELCEGLSQSMIADGAVSIAASSNAGLMGSGEAVKLGMIIYELVINALKHGFSDGRIGHIAIVYVRKGARWRLSVSDNGVGMHAKPAAYNAGLGSRIISALVGRLEARMNVSFTGIGTTTIVRH